MPLAPCHAMPCHAPHDTPEAETRKVETIATRKHTPTANRARQLEPWPYRSVYGSVPVLEDADTASRDAAPRARRKHQRCPRTLRAQDAEGIPTA